MLKIHGFWLPMASCPVLLALLALPLPATSSSIVEATSVGANAGPGAPKLQATSGEISTPTTTAGQRQAAPAGMPTPELPAAATRLDPAKEILARVGDTTISTQELFVFSRNNPQTNRLLGTAEGRALVLRQIIENRLINLTAVERAGLAPGYDLEDLRAAAKNLELEALGPDPVTDDEVEAFYRQNQATFGIPAAVRIREVFFPVPDDADAETKAAIRAAAEDLRAKLVAGADFPALAAQLAHTPALRQVAGDQGFLPLYAFPYLETSTAGMTEGDISPVMTLPGGFQVFQLLGRQEAILSPFEAVAGLIRNHLQEASAMRKRNDLLKAAAVRYGVSIQVSELQAAWPIDPNKASQP